MHTHRVCWWYDASILYSGDNIEVNMFLVVLYVAHLFTHWTYIIFSMEIFCRLLTSSSLKIFLFIVCFFFPFFCFCRSLQMCSAARTSLLIHYCYSRPLLLPSKTSLFWLACDQVIFFSICRLQMNLLRNLRILTVIWDLQTRYCSSSENQQF